MDATNGSSVSDARSQSAYDPRVGDVFYLNRTPLTQPPHSEASHAAMIPPEECPETMTGLRITSYR